VGAFPALVLVSLLVAFQSDGTRPTAAFTYDSDGLVLTITETDTTSHSLPYSTNGQTRVWTFTYTTASGVKQLTSVDGPRTDVSDTTSYQYTAAGYLSRITNAVGHQINITSHDGMGRPLSITDQNGVVTDLEYNARGWLTKSSVRHGAGDAVTSDRIQPGRRRHQGDAARRLVPHLHLRRCAAAHGHHQPGRRDHRVHLRPRAQRDRAGDEGQRRDGQAHAGLGLAPSFSYAGAARGSRLSPCGWACRWRAASRR
jgi:YD repeat-containing protein